MNKARVGEYVRTLQTEDCIPESLTVKNLIDGITEQLDVDGVESSTKERKLEKLRAFLETIPPTTTVKTMANWL